MVTHGWSLIYGGGKVGLMGAVARGVKAEGGHVIGVIPEFMKSRELAFDGADEMVTVETMAERKGAMLARADAFLALPGGIGTLEEIAEALTLRSLAKIHGRAVFFNQDGFYDDLFRFFDRITTERFKASGMSRLYAVASTVDAIWPLLETAAGYEADPIWRPAAG